MFHLGNADDFARKRREGEEREGGEGVGAFVDNEPGGCEE